MPGVIRICAALDTTETFKQKKHELVRDGFDPHHVTDPLFLREPKSGEYRPIDARAYARIVRWLDPALAKPAISAPSQSRG